MSESELGNGPKGEFFYNTTAKKGEREKFEGISFFFCFSLQGDASQNIPSQVKSANRNYFLSSQGFSESVGGFKILFASGWVGLHRLLARSPASRAHCRNSNRIKFKYFDQ